MNQATIENAATNLTNATVNTQFTNPSFIRNSSDFNNTVVRENNLLFRMGDRLDGLFQVNSGVVKLFTLSESGDEHIVRFCMPGDLFGLEVLGDGISKTNALVLDIANVCLIPLASVMNRGKEFDLGVFMGRIAETLAQENEHCMMISRATASRRLAWFLCEYADKLARRGLVGDCFDLPMTRADIGLFLGLALETISRELARFHKQGLINKKLRHIEILDIDSLRILAKDSKQLH